MYKICLFNKHTNKVKTICTKEHLTDALNTGVVEMEFFCSVRPCIFIENKTYTISSKENNDITVIIKKMS